MDLDFPYTEEKDKSSKQFFSSIEKAVTVCNSYMENITYEIKQKWNESYNNGQPCTVSFPRLTTEQVELHFATTDIYDVIDYTCQYHTLYKVRIQRVPLL